MYIYRLQIKWGFNQKNRKKSLSIGSSVTSRRTRTDCIASVNKVVKSADGVAAWKTAGSVALHWSSLDEACCSVKPDEARE
jgi:hypothetical protein